MSDTQSSDDDDDEIMTTGTGLCSLYPLSLYLKDLFIYLFCRERRGESPKLTLHRAQHRAPSHNPEIVTWAETENWTLNQLSQPGAPTPSALQDICTPQKLSHLTPAALQNLSNIFIPISQMKEPK